MEVSVEARPTPARDASIFPRWRWLAFRVARKSARAHLFFGYRCGATVLCQFAV